VIVGNEVGVIFEVVWQNAYSDKEHGNIPAGLNARLKIDSKTNPRLVRNMRMDPPAVHSMSVGVTFDWEKSHPKMDESEFWRALGTYGKDGKLVRRVVSEIQAYHELSLVPHGADPYAQIITDRGLNNPKYAARNHKYPKKVVEETHGYQFSLTDFKKMGHYHDYRRPGEAIRKQTIHKLNNLNNDNDMTLEEFLNSLANVEALGLTEEELTVEVALEAIEKAVKSTTENAEVGMLTSQLDAANKELATVKQELTNLQPRATELDAVIQTTKDEAIRLYKLSKGEDTSTEMLELISRVKDYPSALVFVNQFKKDTENKFSAKCSNCGSTNVTRASSDQGEEEIIEHTSNGSSDQGGGGSGKKMSVDEALESISKDKSAFNTSRMHQDSTDGEE
jgi:hypothetical protein